MGNITQIDKNIPKLSTKQFDRTFRRRNLTNECVAYVDKSCKIFRVTDFVLEVIPFQKNKLLYYPIEHICPETQQILNLKTKTALNVIGIQACNNTEGTLDIIWSFRRPNLPTLDFQKVLYCQILKKNKALPRIKQKGKKQKSKKKVKTKQKTPKLDGEFEIENCKYVEEQKETDEEEKNQETDKQQEKEKQEITKESETNENKKEKKQKPKKKKNKTKKKEIKTGKKIKKKRIKKKINKNTNKKGV